jgi:hypothetical protein
MAVDTDQPLHTDFQTGLLENFPLACFSNRLARVHCASRQAPLAIVCSPCKKDSTAFIENGSAAAQPDFSLTAKPFTIQNLGHIYIPSTDWFHLVICCE